MKPGSGYRIFFEALPESGAGPIEWSRAECQRVGQALRRSAVFKQTWLRAAVFRMLAERQRLLQDGAANGTAPRSKGSP